MPSRFAPRCEFSESITPTRQAAVTPNYAPFLNRSPFAEHKFGFTKNVKRSRRSRMNQQTSHSQFNPTTRPTAVIGAGTLGSRIALMLASSGGEVRLYDAKTTQLEVAARFIDPELPKLVKSRAGAVAGRVVFAKALEPAVADAWMVVEAVPERLD